MSGVFGPLWEGRKDLVLVLCMVGILVALFTPIPSPVLDVLLIANVSLALLILLLTFYTDKPLSFSTFPSLLLIATLFRLALNISATRLILEHADGGRVIGAVGTYVVGGNYVIGLVVFLILVVVQYVVVTNGAQRVAEVAARFTLDSMPGKQMSIDADMNMGLIDEKEARARRAQIEREANFYGAMDGATKFVKGDAIAGIIIILINIVGGLAIGIAQHGMGWGEALQTYTLLTVGDGIVTQIPSLVVATATGIIITRAATDERLGEEVARQVLAQPRTLAILALALLGILFLPGIPVMPVVLVFMAVAVAGWFAHRARREPGTASTPASTAKEDVKARPAEDALSGALRIEPLEIRVGARLAGGIAAGHGFDERIGNLRRQLALELGVIAPVPRLLPDARLPGDDYALAIHDTVVGAGTLKLDRQLAIGQGGRSPPLEGEPTTEPTYGLPAVWIEPDARAHARAQGYTVADCETVLLTHLGEALRRNAAELVTRGEAERLVARVRERHAALVDELVPAVLTYTDVQKVLQALLREKVSIRHLEAILEVLADQGRTTKVADELAERVRERLGASICQSLADPKGEVHVMTLAPELERGMLLARQREAGAAPLLEPARFDQLIADLARQSESMMGKSLMPVLLCAPALRRTLARLLLRTLPHVVVLGLNEVPPATRVRSFAMVGAAAPAAA